MDAGNGHDEQPSSSPHLHQEYAHPHEHDHFHSSEHHHEPSHDADDHSHGERSHERQRHIHGVADRLAHVIKPHHHDHTETFDDALTASKAGTRALAVSLAGLALTAVVQVVIFAVSDSVGLFADAIHNFADAFTAVPIGLAFVAGRRAANERYTYGYGRAEDLAGLVVVLVIAVSAVVATIEATDRLLHPHHVAQLGLVAVAGAIGFIGNELAARYRIGVGRRIGSAALIADGRHARTDGFTSLAVVLGAAGVGLGWRLADPIVGLSITVAILSVLRGAARDVYRRLMDAVEPSVVERVRSEARDVVGVDAVDRVRVRWLGHELQAELEMTVDRNLALHAAHAIAEEVSHHLLHDIPRLANVVVHINPRALPGIDEHRLTAHHARR